MLRIGIVGMGVMGKAHFNAYAAMNDRVRVVAVADVDAAKRRGEWGALQANVALGETAPDIADLRAHATWSELIADPEVDVVDVTLPTYLHAPCVLEALAAGKHVICEKPMALDADTARRMAAAAREAGRQLFVGHCIRFWPAYAEAAARVRDGHHGAVVTARFQRLSARPRWSWDGWLQDSARSDRAALDLHIHDADFIAWAFGRPQRVSAWGQSPDGHGYDHIVARYDYGDGRLIFAEGAWEYAPGHPFSMVFTIQFEQGTLALDAGGALTFYPEAGGADGVDVPAGSGYDHELAHFVDCLAAGRDSDVITPESAADSVALVEAEIRSAREGVSVAL